MTSEKRVSHNTVREAKVCRDLIRKGFHQHHTAVLAPGFVQANLVILPKVYAADFEGFCRLNPKPCPLLARTEPGETEIKALAVGSDIRTDLPQYRVWKSGEMQRETTNISDLWRDDFVSFLIGCSFSFDNLLSVAKIPVRHRDTGRNVPMFRTNIPCTPVGPFRGNMVVSMRPVHPRHATVVRELSGRLPLCHGDPVHWGNFKALGINNIQQPDFGEPVEIFDGEEPVFWACGVTPQVALENAKLDFAITHKPGYMFITDIRDTQLEGAKKIPDFLTI